MTDLRNPVQTPCSQRWEEMEGDDHQRFCQHCQESVYNLSALTAADAARFLAEHPERCRMVQLDKQGLPIYQPEPTPRLPGLLGALRRAAAAGLAAPLLALSACEATPDVQPIPLDEPVRSTTFSEDRFITTYKDRDERWRVWREICVLEDGTELVLSKDDGSRGCSHWRAQDLQPQNDAFIKVSEELNPVFIPRLSLKIADASFKNNNFRDDGPWLVKNDYEPARTTVITSPGPPEARSRWANQRQAHFGHYIEPEGLRLGK